MTMWKFTQISREIRKSWKEKRRQPKTSRPKTTVTSLKKIRVKVEKFTFRNGNNKNVLRYHGLG